MKKFGKWLKAIFGKCTYAADRAYETQFEQRQQRGQDLPPLPPIPPPPQYDLSSLSYTDSDDEEEQQGQAADWDETLEGYHQRQEPRCSIRSTRYTTATHRQDHARIDSDDDDGDGGARTAAESARAGGDDIDWMDI